MAFFTAYAANAKKLAQRQREMTAATAATMAAIAETVVRIVFMTNLFLSVRSLDAGVSTNWFNSSTPVM